MLRNKHIWYAATATAGILVLHLIAMQLTDEITWTISDFVLAGVLLFGAGFTYESVARSRDNAAYRTAFGLAVATLLILIWMNLAVGLIGSEDNPANALYFGVLLVALSGFAFARFRAPGMARAMIATAGAQAIVPVIAMIAWNPPITTKAEIMGVLGVFILNGLFVLLFVVAALLFPRASGRPQQLQ